MPTELDWSVNWLKRYTSIAIARKEGPRGDDGASISITNIGLETLVPFIPVVDEVFAKPVAKLGKE